MSRTAVLHLRRLLPFLALLLLLALGAASASASGDANAAGPHAASPLLEPLPTSGYREGFAALDVGTQGKREFEHAGTAAVVLLDTPAASEVAAAAAAASSSELPQRMRGASAGLKQASNSSRPHPHDHPGSGKQKEMWLQPYLRWLWWIVVLYLFWAQAEVCDEYFVPSIEVISEVLRIPEDAAGATVMALGCNGPELFINTMALFRDSDLGIGAVVGGEVFNLLVICGCAILVTPAAYLPLRIGKFSFSRDVFFYAVSVGLLFWTLRDNVVTLTECLVLLVSGIVYSVVVAQSANLRELLARRSRFAARGQPASAGSSPASPLSRARGFSTSSLDAATGQPAEGCLMGVRVQLENRMLDRSRHWESRFVRLAPDGLLVSTHVRCRHVSRTARGIVFDHAAAGNTGSWHYGGLVNAPTEVIHQRSNVVGLSKDDSYGDLAFAATVDSSSIAAAAQEAVSADIECRSMSEVMVADRPWERIPLRDVLTCVAPLNPQSARFELQVLQRDGLAFGLGKLIRLEFDAKSQETRKRWVAAIVAGLQDAELQAQDAASANASAGASAGRGGDAGAASGFPGWWDWFRFPVQYVLRATIPDMKRSGNRRWLPLSFAMSMVWLAVFSFGVVEICDILHDEFGISVTILGFTLAAVGTSFPNVISCVAVSRQGKTTMAIANALGANIQNVFVALALPWTVRAIASGSFGVADGNLDTSVAAMVVTLLLLVLLVVAARCTMPRWAGAAFLATYAVYLALTIMQEAVCARWPLPC